MKQVENAGGLDLRKFLLIELGMSALCNGLINIGMAHAAFGVRIPTRSGHPFRFDSGH